VRAHGDAMSPPHQRALERPGGTMSSEVMMPGTRDPLVSLLALPKRSRARVAVALLDSLGPRDAPFDVARELDRRLDAADAGRDGARPWSEVRVGLARKRRRRLTTP